MVGIFLSSVSRGRTKHWASGATWTDPLLVVQWIGSTPWLWPITKTNLNTQLSCLKEDEQNTESEKGLGLRLGKQVYIKNIIHINNSIQFVLFHDWWFQRDLWQNSLNIEVEKCTLTHLCSNVHLEVLVHNILIQASHPLHDPFYHLCKSALIQRWDLCVQHL